MTRIAVVTGNPKPNSRTHSVARAVAGVLAAELGGEPRRLEIDLAEHAAALFDWSDPTLSRLTEEVAGSEIAVFASPTYKASYTGMLKAFLDRYGSNGLAGVVAVPVMTGGWPGHLLAVEVHLRPVLVELAATVPSRGLYVTEPELADLQAPVANWAATAAPLIRAALRNLSRTDAFLRPRGSYFATGKPAARNPAPARICLRNSVPSRLLSPAARRALIGGNDGIACGFEKTRRRNAGRDN